MYVCMYICMYVSAMLGRDANYQTVLKWADKYKRMQVLVNAETFEDVQRGLIMVHIHTYIHTYTYIYTHTYTLIHTYIHAVCSRIIFT